MATKKINEEKGIPGRTIGVKTGLRKGAFFIKLMKENASAKLSDEKLAEALAKEYPQATSPWLSRIAGIRNAFNNGVIPDQDKKPAKALVRFGSDGEPYKRAAKGTAKAKPAAKAKPVAKKAVVKPKLKLKIKAKPAAEPELVEAGG